MANVFDVAKYILEKQGRMSTWKLQKLCYYAQAWAYTWTEKPLFDEDFEAWANGPVCPRLFREHKGRYMLDEYSLTPGSSNALTDDEKESIDTVLGYYGDKEAFWLREQTHSEDPWINARRGVPDGAACSNIITKEDMGAYYGSL
ncbi:MAG: Panacea domain-containing protein [Christensenellales bacterium]